MDITPYSDDTNKVKRITISLLVLILIGSLVNVASGGCGCAAQPKVVEVQVKMTAEAAQVPVASKAQQEQKTQNKGIKKNLTVQEGEEVSRGKGQEEKKDKESSEDTTGQVAGKAQKARVEQETENTTIHTQHKERFMVEPIRELKQRIQEKKQELNRTLQGLGKEKQKVYQNQNQIRLAVHSLFALENLTGGIGRNVSKIAREFNNSVQATIRAEERVQGRSGLMRFFMGGDEEAAEELEAEVNRNGERIQQLNRLMGGCDCDEEVMAMLQEQVQSMEQEQTRLGELAHKEKKEKGLFGWLFRSLK